MKTTSAITLTACALLAGTSLARAADVTPDRLTNADPTFDTHWWHHAASVNW